TRRSSDLVLHGLAAQPLGGGFADRLDAEAAALEELGPHLLAQEIGELLVLRCASLVFDAGVDGLGVLAEDDDVDFLRVLEWRGDAGIVTHRSDAGIQVELLPE